MPHSTLRMSFSFYNRLGISSIVFNKNGISASKAVGIANVVKCLIVLIFILIFLGNDELKRKALRTDMKNVDKMTIVAKVAFYVSTLVNVATAVFLCFRQFTNQKTVLTFIKGFENVRFSEKLSNKLRQTWKTHVSVMFAFFIVFLVVQFYGRSKFTLLGALVFCLLTYPYYILLIFMSLMKSFEFLFSTFLEDFENDLKFISRSLEGSRHQMLSKKHQQLYDLRKAFNGAFGLDNTVLTSCIACSAVLQVRNLDSGMKV